MTLALLTALLAFAMQPAATHRTDCVGGRMIFFAPGSDQLDADAIAYLEPYVRAPRPPDIDNQIDIESGGDGEFATFNADLSRRRSEAIRAFLIERGFQADRIRIHVRQNWGVRSPEGEEDELFQRRIGHVSERISREEYVRRFGPYRFSECF